MYRNVKVETAKYLKIEPHQIDFHRIFADIQVLALGSNLVLPEMKLDTIHENEGITVSELKYRYKITQNDIEKVAK